MLPALGELLRADLLLRFDLAKGRRFEPAVLVEGREPLPVRKSPFALQAVFTAGEAEGDRGCRDGDDLAIGMDPSAFSER